MDVGRFLQRVPAAPITTPSFDHRGAFALDDFYERRASRECRFVLHSDESEELGVGLADLRVGRFVVKTLISRQGLPHSFSERGVCGSDVDFEVGRASIGAAIRRDDIVLPRR